MHSGRVSSGLHSLQAAAPLFPRFEALAVKLVAVANLNRTVHLENYNQLIGAAALSLRN